MSINNIQTEDNLEVLGKNGQSPSRQKLEEYLEWNRTNEGEKPSLQGLDLAGEDLNEVDLSDADLTNANLTNAILDRSNLKGAILNGANLSNASTERHK